MNYSYSHWLAIEIYSIGGHNLPKGALETIFQENAGVKSAGALTLFYMNAYNNNVRIYASKYLLLLWEWYLFIWQVVRMWRKDECAQY